MATNRRRSSLINSHGQTKNKMRHLLYPKYIVTPPERKEGTPEHLEWLKEVKPTRLIEWREFSEKTPSINSKIYIDTDGDISGWYFWSKLNLTYSGVTPNEKWCYANEYEPAKAQEDRWEPLGKGWVKSCHSDSSFWNGKLNFTFDGEYWELEMDGEFKFEISKHLAYADTINQIIKDLKEL